MLRRVLIIGSLLLSAASFAQTLTVTSPLTNDFLGRTNQLKFNITSATAQVNMKVKTINVANPLIFFQTNKRFDPDSDQKINGSIDLNFDRSTPQGIYKIEVIGESNVNTALVTINNVTIDVVEPKFLDSNPITGAYVRGDVPIRLGIEEANVDEWRVQVNGTDIPNNTGTSNTVDVTWSTAGIDRDGSQSINIKVDDKAKNSSSKNISVTLDRVAPNIQVISPSGSGTRPNATIPVSINIVDQFSGSVTPLAVDVIAYRMDNSYLQRIARIGARNNGSTLNWTGRIRKTTGFPNQFKLVVNAIDRAGNPAASQTVVVNLR